ncbi:TetR/AcrR family transcriptional regulator [Cryptosporangium sp. NPDC051539]|uniref:TetR/AcrR family transcriptional regulator n=1 Tax=Cryptosporangium sp. NPDC051539 TaxID=3363962 RepID=UPI0037A65001
MSPAAPSLPAAEPSSSRSRERRDEIARNAGELFAARGFHAVRMDDIAEASGVTARVLYRHYSSKQALLAHVVLDDQQRLINTLTRLTASPAEERDLDSTLRTIVDAALESRRLSPLWQREARHLDADAYQRVRDHTRSMAKQFTALLLDPGRPGLDAATAEVRTWGVVSILTGSGLHEPALARPHLDRELVASSRRVIDLPAEPVTPAERTAATGRAPLSRRDQLIDAAAKAFRERGFGGVSVDDIGAQVGFVGPALYRYHDNKAEILVAAVNRFDEWTALEAYRAMHAPGPDDGVLAQLVRGYVRVALEATDLLAVSLTERPHLPDAVRDRFDRVQADQNAEWERWLRVARPDVGEAQAAVLARTARTIIHDCARIPHLRRHPDLGGELTNVVLASLGVPPTAPPGR